MTLDRRDFLKRATALAAASLLPAPPVVRQTIAYDPWPAGVGLVIFGPGGGTTLFRNVGTFANPIWQAIGRCPHEVKL